MRQFIVIKRTFDDEKEILDIFKSLVGNRVESMTMDDYLVYKYDYENQDDVKNLFISYGNENMVDIIGYVSTARSIADKELEIALNLVKYLPLGVYNLKEALLAATRIDNKKQILDYILYASGADELFVKQFIENDLNVSRASKAMYIHRNTLNYKLDKLKETSSFDLRTFVDAYVLYSLIIQK